MCAEGAERESQKAWPKEVAGPHCNPGPGVERAAHCECAQNPRPFANTGIKWLHIDVDVAGAFF